LELLNSICTQHSALSTQLGRDPAGIRSSLHADSECGMPPRVSALSTETRKSLKTRQD